MELLGKIVKDKITGFEGMATSHHSYLTGCSQYGLQAKINDQNIIPGIQYFDVGRLEFVKEGLTKEDVSAGDDGCDFREHPIK